MAINTYAGLVTSIGNWLHRIDLGTLIPDWVAMVEADFNRTYRHQRMLTQATLNGTETTVTDGLGTNVSRYPLPADFLQAERVLVDGVKMRILGDTPFANTFGAVYPSVDQPLFYSIEGGNVVVGAKPSATASVILTYFARVPALTGAAPSNWLLTWHPDVYLYGALVYGCSYTQDFELAPTFQQYYKNALDGVRSDDAAYGWSGDELVPYSEYAV